MSRRLHLPRERIVIASNSDFSEDGAILSCGAAPRSVCTRQPSEHFPSLLCTFFSLQIIEQQWWVRDRRSGFFALFGFVDFTSLQSLIDLKSVRYIYSELQAQVKQVLTLLASFLSWLHVACITILAYWLKYLTSDCQKSGKRYHNVTCSHVFSALRGRLHVSFLPCDWLICLFSWFSIS